VPKSRSIITLAPTLIAAALLAACGGSSGNSNHGSTTTSSNGASSGGSSVIVKTVKNATLGSTILVSSQGRTLYHLSGEQSGKFICTSSACTGIWHPLTVTGSGTPTGVASLGTVKRPDGTEQVTYNGMPLYTFAQDTVEGDTNGQGIKDVGTWSAVTVSSAPASTSSAAPRPSPSGQGGYGY
jgi:predicted lipoprotein with Yx(FWY)xxD motif